MTILQPILSDPIQPILANILGGTSTPTPVYSPSDEAALANWWKFDETGQADSTPLASLSDSEGSISLAQGTSGSQPTVTNLNGRQCISLDGTDDFLELSADITVSTGDELWFSAANDDLSTGSIVGQDTSSTTFVGWHSATQLRIRAGGGTTDEQFTVGQLHKGMAVYRVVFGASNATFYMNGRLLATSSAARTPTIQIIGARRGSTFQDGMTGLIGEIAYFNGAVTDVDAMWDYMIGRWPTQIYVSASGSDSNTGRTTSAPLGTVTTAANIAAIGQSEILLNRGDVWREEIAPAGVGASATRRVEWKPYGTGARPIIITHGLEETGAWTNSTGTEYTTTLAAKPVVVAHWPDTSDITTMVMLDEGTAGSLATNEWAHSGSTLTINIGQDPTGERIEQVPSGAAQDEGVLFGSGLTNAYLTWDSIDTVLTEGSSFRVNVADVTGNDFVTGWCGNDATATGNAANPTLTRVTMYDSLDEGFSAHGTSDATLEQCEIYRARTFGVNSLAATDVTLNRCLIDNCATAFQMNQTGDPATLTVRNSLIKAGALTGADLVKAASSDTDQTLTIENSTLAGDGSTTNGINWSANMPVNIRNTAFYNFTKGFAKSGGGTGTVDYNGYADCTTDSDGGVTGANDVSTTSAAFTDAAGDDFTLASGSAFIDEGVTIAEVTVDYSGTSRPQGSGHDIGAYERT